MRISVLACVAFAVACAGDTPQRDHESRRDTTAVTARADTVVSDPPPTDTPAVTGTGERVQGTGSGGQIAVLDAVRTARHAAFERVVFEFRDDVLPDYVVEYSTEAPTQCGSGETMHVSGAAPMVVRMSPAQAHAPVGDDERSTIPLRQMVVGYPALKSLTVSCDFEAVLSWVAGVDARRPFRVTVLRQPARLVLDLVVR